MKELMCELARRAGRIALDYRRRLSELKVDTKGTRDLVTEADWAVEGFLVDQITKQYPEHAVLAEESGNRAGNEYRWILDPIDGTMSYMWDLPDFAVSIGLEKAGKPLAGAVYLPVLDELFFAEKGRGAELNRRVIRVSKAETIAEGIFGTGFSCLRTGGGRENLFYLPRILPRINEMRRYGSAAMLLCYVACGRLEGFWEFGLGLHDIAAGRIIIEEAGGKMTDFSGGTDKLPAEVAVTNGKMHEEFLGLLQGIGEEYHR